MSRVKLLYAATAHISTAVCSGASLAATAVFFRSQGQPEGVHEGCRGETTILGVAAMMQQAVFAIHFLVLAADLILRSADVGEGTTCSDSVKQTPGSGIDTGSCWGITMCLSAMSGLGLLTMSQCLYPVRAYTVWITLWTIPGLLIIFGTVLFVAVTLLALVGMLCVKCFEVGKIYVSGWRRVALEGEGFELLAVTSY